MSTTVLFTRLRGLPASSTFDFNPTWVPETISSRSSRVFFAEWVHELLTNRSLSRVHRNTTTRPVKAFYVMLLYFYFDLSYNMFFSDCQGFLGPILQGKKRKDIAHSAWLYCMFLSNIQVSLIHTSLRT